MVRALKRVGCTSILTRGHDELDLTDQGAVRGFFKNRSLDWVVLAAAKVGGIHANNRYPADFIYQNLMIEANVLEAAYQSGVRRLLFLGSSCIYPKLAPQPLSESSLLTGPLEPTNAPYAVAKIAGITLCESYNRQYGAHFFSVMPTNLYGPNDSYDLENSHVLPAMIRKFHLGKLAASGDWDGISRDESVFGPVPPGFRRNLLEALHGDPEVTLWGTGSPKREFLHVEDLADACLFMMSDPDAVFSSLGHGDPPLVNVGTGRDISIAELAERISGVVGYPGKIRWDDSMPDGTPRKLLDVSRVRALGWRPKISLKQGIRRTYREYLERAGEIAF